MTIGNFLTGARSKKDILFKNIGFRIDGFGMDHSAEKWQPVHMNDPTVPDAQYGLSLTNRLYKIQAAFPVFNRVKHLLALTRALIQLKASGMRLTPEMMSQLIETKAYYAAASKGTCLFVAAP